MENLMNKVKEHSMVETIGLHLMPGLAGTIAYVILAPVLINKGYPAILGLLIAALVVIMPIELGILLAVAKKQSGTFSIGDVILYRQPIPKWQYFVIPLGLVVWGFLATGVTPILDKAIASSMFSWLPEWFFIFDLEHFSVYSQPVLLLTFFAGLVINGIVLPLVEELYFRGFLLPRLERFGKWSPVISASLFSLYHFFTPWQFFSRIVWLLPWVYTAWKKRNIYLIIITHCLANTLGWLLTWGLILSQ
jgi:membrane protease YdiL (CAAX protease family)